MIKTRFAPSPTGHLHIGGLRAALYAYMTAKHSNGSFLIRIEDTDQSRTQEGAQEEIVRILATLGLKSDEEILQQSARLDIYKQHAQELFSNDKAYFCQCSPERLLELREAKKKDGGRLGYDRQCADKKLESGVLRLRVPQGRQIVVDDVIRGKVSFNSEDIDDQVLMKSDGFPTYHLAHVVDDHASGITHVIRGEEWLSSTPKHILIYEALGWELPTYAHLPLILGEGGGKLSKRHGARSAEEYLNEGYLPAALINFLVLLGWNPRGDQEVYSFKELIESFDLKKVNKGGAVFSEEKLEWIGQQHMQSADPKELAAMAMPFLGKNQQVAKKRGGEWLEKVITIEQQRISRLSQIGEDTDFAFTDSIEYDPALLVGKKSDKTEAKDRLEKVKDYLSDVDSFEDREALEEDMLGWIKKEDLGNGPTLWPLRVALTGKAKSPSPFDALWLLGKEEAQERIQDAIASL